MGARCSRAVWVVLAAAAFSACTDDARVISQGSPGAGGALKQPGESPVYAQVVLVWSDEGPTGYVSLTDSLDVSSITLDSAREFPGYTSVGVADGQLLVSPSAEDLTIERYDITSGRDWINTGTLSFLNQGVEEVGFYRQYIGAGRAAYLDVDVSGHVLWDPIGFAIEGSKGANEIPLERDGLRLYANFNRTQFVSDNEILRPFSYHDDDWFRWSPDTPIVVYDLATHEPTQTVDAPCPALDSITRDEDGNTYLGSWEYSALFPLMGVGAAPCVVKLRPDHWLDPDWNTDLGALTQGRGVVNFRYLGGGKAIAAVLHAEEYGADFDFGGYLENTDDFWTNSSSYHRLWMFDLDAQTASPVEGIDAFDFVSPWFFHAVIDDRWFVYLSEGDTNFVTQTIVYELEPNGTATRRFDVPGDLTQIIRVR